VPVVPPPANVQQPAPTLLAAQAPVAPLLPPRIQVAPKPFPAVLANHAATSSSTTTTAPSAACIPPGFEARVHDNMVYFFPINAPASVTPPIPRMDARVTAPSKSQGGATLDMDLMKAISLKTVAEAKTISYHYLKQGATRLTSYKGSTANYVAWRAFVMSTLDLEGIAFAVTATFDFLHQDGHAYCVQLAKCVMHWLRMTLEDGVNSTTLHLTTPFALFRDLAATYQDISYGSSVELQSKLFTTFYKPGQLVHEHIKDLRLVQSECIAAGFPCPDSTFAGAVLVTMMRHGYQTFRSILDEYRGRSAQDPFPSSDLITALESSQRLMLASSSGVRYAAAPRAHGHDDRRSQWNSSQAHNSGNGRAQGATTSYSGSQSSRERSSGRHSSLECNYCHLMGHIARDCRKRAYSHPHQGDNSRSSPHSAPTSNRSDNRTPSQHRSHARPSHRVMAAAIAPEVTQDDRSWLEVPARHARQGHGHRTAPVRIYNQANVARTSRIYQDAAKLKTAFLPDSGAEISVVNNISMLHNVSFTDNILVMPAVGAPVLSVARGDLKLQLDTLNSGPWHLLLRNVYCVPTFSINVLSISQLALGGIDAIFANNKLTLTQPSAPSNGIVSCDNVDGPYTLYATCISPSITTEAPIAAAAQLVAAGIPLESHPSSDTQHGSTQSLTNAPRTEPNASDSRSATNSSGPTSFSSPTSTLTSQASRPKPISMDLLHLRLGHFNIAQAKLMPSMSTGTSLLPGLPSTCDSCLLAKSTRLPFGHSSSISTTRPLELIHSDLCGPLPVEAHTGHWQYFITFTDDYSRYTSVKFLQTKDDAAQAIKDYIVLYSNQLDTTVKTFHTDGGGELINHDLDNYFADHGITRLVTTPHTPQLNGVAERVNRSLLSSARASLHWSDLPDNLWAFAVEHAAYCLNRLPRRGAEKLPFQLFWNKIPDTSNLRPWGCASFVHNNKHITKLVPRSSIKAMVGISNDHTYLLYDLESRSISTSRDVKFIEHQPAKSYVPNAALNSPSLIDTASLEGEVINVPLQQTSISTSINQQASMDPSSISTSTVSSPIERTTTSASVPRPSPAIAANPRPAPTSLAAGREPRRHVPVQPKWMSYVTIDHASPTAEPTSPVDEPASPTVESDSSAANPAPRVPPTPLTMTEARASTDWPHWKKACDKEIASHKQNRTFRLTRRPRGQSILRSMWIFKVKITPGHEPQFKARLVIKGCAQRPGRDFDDTSSPVVSLTSLRIVSAIAAHLGWNADHYDVSTAYLNGELDHIIYAHQPEGFEAVGQEDDVWLLLKSIYGLRQAGLQWYKKIHQAMTTLGFVRLTVDSCVYVRQSEGTIIIVLLYVDDLIIFYNHGPTRDQFKTALFSIFQMKDLSPLSFALGIEFIRGADGTLKLQQSTYAASLLERFDLMDINPCDTPMDTAVELRKATSTDTIVDHSLYRERVGAIIYLSNNTRPDICYSVHVLARHCVAPTRAHHNAVIRVFRYIKATLNYGITFYPSSHPRSSIAPIAYSDADWAADKDDGRSVSGSIIMIAGGAAISKTEKQTTVAISTNESEFYALGATVRMILFVRNFYFEVGLQELTSIPTTTLYNDNAGAQALALATQTARSRHINARHFFIREHLEAGTIMLVHLPGEELIADALTKALARPRHQKLISMLGTDA